MARGGGLVMGKKQDRIAALETALAVTSEQLDELDKAAREFLLHPRSRVSAAELRRALP